MRRDTLRSALPILALPLALAGCMTGREAMTARLEIATPACAVQPSLTPATPFAAPKKKDEPFTATVRISDAAPCLADAAGIKSVYTVLDLPQADPTGIITVTSFAMGSTIFSPKLEFRDEHGAVTRQVGRETFMFSGTSLQTQLRQRPGERYLVIASDGASVGKTVDQIQSTFVMTGVVAGPVYVPVSSGGEARAKLVFAHNGEVTATIAPMPKADGK